MTALVVLGQAVSLWLMWRYRHACPTPAEDGDVEHRRSEPFSVLSP